MGFRLRTAGWHLLGSVLVFAVVLGALYVGWYRWPAWYLAGALPVTTAMTGADLVLGPLTTLLIAAPAKPRRVLARDIAAIVAMQLAFLAFASYTLWNGRPLYYTFSAERLELVRAFEIPPQERALAERLNPEFAPHWYSRPRWVWAALPSDPKAAEAIVRSAVDGGLDVIDMPRFFRPWQDGLPQLRGALRPIAAMTNIALRQREQVRARMHELGLPLNQPNAILMAGRDDPLVAIYDPATLQPRALLRTR